MYLYVWLTYFAIHLKLTTLLINYAPKKKKRHWGACCLERADWVLVSGWRTKRGKGQSRRALGVGPGKERVIMESPGITTKQGKRPGLQLPRKVKKEPAEELGSGICTSNLCSYHPMVTIHLILRVQLALALQTVTRREGLTYSMWEGGVWIGLSGFKGC